MQDKSFKEKKILITGISGFVGSNLAARLKELGAEVYGISKSMTSRNILRADILDYERLNKFIKERKIDICFHLAAESLVETGQEDPYSTFKTNIEGTLNILESARRNKVRKIIIASTVHVYGNNKIPYLEEYTPRPSRPYETSKACIDLIAQSYANSFNLPVAVPRFANIYGPNDLHFERLIPRTIKAVLENKSPRMWGGEAVRDYLFIDDALKAYISLAKLNLKRVKGNRIFNFGSGNRISVRNLVEKIIKLSGNRVVIDKITQGRNEEILTQYASWNKARKLLHWEPKVDLEEGLKRTIEWYKTYQKKKRY